MVIVQGHTLNKNWVSVELNYNPNNLIHLLKGGKSHQVELDPLLERTSSTEMW